MSSIWPGERFRKKEWICRSRPGPARTWWRRRTVGLPLALVGITVAALAEAIEVRAANESLDHLGDGITTYAQTLSGFGQIIAAAAQLADGPAEILFPSALLRRTARYIGSAADLAANGGKLPDGIPETARSQLAATLRSDADGLTAITATGWSAAPRNRRLSEITRQSQILHRASFLQDNARIIRVRAVIPDTEANAASVSWLAVQAWSGVSSMRLLFCR